MGFSSNIDFTTMKKWIPDYDNADSTNLLAGSLYTFSISQIGFVYVFWEGYNDAGTNVDVSFKINEATAARVLSENTSSSGARTGSLSITLPVNTGDTFEISRNTGTNTNRKEAFFIPGKYV